MLDAKTRNSIEGSLIRFEQWAEYALKAAVPEENTFCRLAYVLFRAVKLNFQALGTSYNDRNQTMMAWSCRNLLELGIITSYVLESKANANEFEADRFIDALEIATAIKGIYDSINPFPTNPDPTVDGAIAVCARVMKENGVTRSKYLSMEKLAKHVGLIAEHKHMNKVCSKLVHPTSWSLFDEGKSITEFPSVHELFYLYGAKNLSIVLTGIKRHVEQYGLKHRA